MHFCDSRMCGNDTSLFITVVIKDEAAAFINLDLVNVQSWAGVC